MTFVKKNKGVIIFYLLLVATTLVVVNFNERHLSNGNQFVYLDR